MGRKLFDLIRDLVGTVVVTGNPSFSLLPQHRNKSSISWHGCWSISTFAKPAAVQGFTRAARNSLVSGFKNNYRALFRFCRWIRRRHADQCYRRRRTGENCRKSRRPNSESGRVEQQRPRESRYFRFGTQIVRKLITYSGTYYTLSGMGSEFYGNTSCTFRGDQAILARPQHADV